MRAVSCLAPGLPEELSRILAGVVGADVWFERRTSGPLSDDDPVADVRDRLVDPG